MNEKKYFIITYGCQMNIHESEKIGGILENEGFVLSKSEEDADVIVFNTCCVREHAEERLEGNIGALKKWKLQNKNKLIIVGGCAVQQDGYANELKKKFPFIDIIFGTHNLPELPTLLNRRLSTNKSVVDILPEGEINECVKPERTSFPNAWVNISYGCNNFCSYCIVPYVRGREMSRKAGDVISEVKRLVEDGYKEITLLGQNVNSYGKDIGVTFASLLSEIDEICGDYRIRFMSSHPKDLNEDVVKVIASGKHICRCIHLPVQAGSTRVLSLMNRKYSREDYIKRIEMIRSYLPDCAITTDIMVGFPTETEEDFLDTLNLVKTVRFSSAFTFIYSRRRGTVADKMDGQIDEAVKKERIVRLIDAQNEITREISADYKDKTVQILCDGYDNKRMKYFGRDEGGRMAYFSAEEDLTGKFVSVKITDPQGMSLFGERV